MTLILVNLTYCRPYNQDPKSSSDLHNALYFAISRPTFSIGAVMILVAILCEKFQFAKALLSSSNLRLLAKSLPIACVLQILVIQWLFTSSATPEGI
jgi:hypothetical protein